MALAGPNFMERVVKRLVCLVRRHDVVVLAHEGRALLACHRCRWHRSVPVIGDARQASIGEAVERLKAAGVTLIDDQMLAELQLGWRVERAFAEVSEPWE